MRLVEIDGLEFELRRSDRRSTVGITVERDGRLVLAAPSDASVEDLDRVVAQRRDWIEDKLAAKAEVFRPMPPKEYVSGEGFRYLGRSYRLKIIPSEPDGPALRLLRGRFELRGDARSEGREHYVRWYTRQLEPRLQHLVADLAPRVGAEPSGVRVRDLGYRWGSRGRDGLVYIHWRVAMLPPTAIEYVVAHEMVHLVERRHGKAFWQRVSRLMPDYAERVRCLAQHGGEYYL